MANDLYKQYGQIRNNHMQNMINQFNQFKQTFKGNPQEVVQELLNSGRMTQDQFNELKQMADQLQNMLK